MLKRVALLGFLALLMVGNLPGPVEAGWVVVATARRVTRDITAPIITQGTMAGAAVMFVTEAAAATAVTAAAVTEAVEAAGGGLVRRLWSVWWVWLQWL